MKRYLAGNYEFEPVEIHQTIMEKGSITMRIAVTYEDGEVFQHFGHCAQFKLYDVDYNAVGKGNYEGSSESEQVSVDRIILHYYN